MNNKTLSALFLLALIASATVLVISLNIEPAQSATPSFVISGTVYDTEGNPSSNAYTYLIDASTGRSTASCYSGYAGFYYLTAPAGTYILVASIPGTAQCYSKQNIVLTSDSTLNIHLIVGLKISGHVSDSAGQPVIGAQTNMYNTTWTVPGTNTDAYGNFTVYAPAGTYKLILWPPTNSLLINYENTTFTVNSETTCNISMSYGFKVSGYIYYPSGDAVSGVSTYVINGTGQTYASGHWSDSSGFYSIIVPSGTYTLRAGVNNSVVSYSEPNIAVDSDITKDITLITASISPTTATVDTKQSYLYTAMAQGGSGTYNTYVWYVNGLARAAASNSTFNFQPTTPGTYTITVAVTDSWGASSTQSTTASATVNSALTLPNLSSSADAIDQGQTCQLSSTEASTGTAPYTYQWCSKAPSASTYSAISGATSLDYTFPTSSSTEVGEWRFILNVTDSPSKPNTASSTAVSVWVNAPPAVSVYPELAALDEGSTKTFTAITIGGSDSLTYEWFVDNAKVGGNNTSYPYIAASGTHTLYVKVTDSASPPLSATSNTVTITTNPPLTIPSASAINSTIDQGQTLKLNAMAAVNGTPPYLYQWYAKGPDGNYSALTGATSPSYSVDTSANITAGVWYFVLHVTDSATTPVTATSNIITVTINAAPSVSVSPTSAAFNVGQSATFTASATGGSGNYTGYQWYVNGAAQQGQAGSTFSFSPTSTGSYSVAAIVTDSLGATSNMSAAAQVQASPAPTPTPAPTQAPSPTATPNPTAASTPTPTSTATQNPTATPAAIQPTATQDVTQGPQTGTYAIISIALAIIIIVLIVAILVSKKTKKP